MPHLDRLFEKLDRKARRIRFLSRFALLFPAAAGAGVVLALALHAVGLSFPARMTSGVILAVSSFGLAAVAASLLSLGRIQRGKLLFALDTLVDQEGRLSALYEVRRTGSSRLYERALAPLVAARADRYVAALRLSRRSRICIVLGLVAVVILVVTPWIGAAVRPAAGPPEAGGEPPTASSATADAGSDRGEEDRERPVEDGTLPPESEGVVLDDVLESLRSSRTTPDDEIVEDLPTSPEAVEAATAGRPTSFAGFLFELSERISSAGDVEMSEAERGLISEILPDVDEEIAADLEALLSESDPDAAKETIERLLQSEEGFPDVDLTPLDSDATRQGEETAGRDSGEPEQAPADESAESEMAQGDAAGETARDRESEDGAYPITDFGDTEEPVPELVEAELSAELGETGDLFEYITRGVPIEPPDQGADETSPYVVDFDRIRSILDGRSIPADAYEVVQRYFETITEGGP